jgi:thiol-disulfide isomerase/thioredoxin
VFFITIVLLSLQSSHKEQLPTDWQQPTWQLKQQQQQQLKQQPRSRSLQQQTKNTLMVPTNYNVALQISKKTNKKIFLYFTAEWCVYCKKMTPIFNNLVVKKQLDNMVVYHIDIDKEPQLATKYQISTIPAYRIIDGNERVLKVGQGYKSLDEFSIWLNIKK